MTSILLALYLAAVPTVTVTGRVLAPDGAAPTSGSVTCRLTTSASALDGVTMQAVGGEVTATLGTGGSISMALVPNDAMTPTGTRYTCTYLATMANGRRVQWARQWQLASSPATQDVGSVPVPTYPLGACMPAAPPSISPAGGSFMTSQTVSLSGSTPSSTIYYTTNGSQPTTSSTAYSTPITVSSPLTLSAISVAAGFGSSSTTSAAFVLPSVLFNWGTTGCVNSGTAADVGAYSATFSRGTTATYTNDSGALASCTSTQARVDALGFISEPAATTILTTPMTTATWTAFGSVVAAPTVTNNTADVLAPDGTQTATKLVFPAVSANNNYSVFVNQNRTATAEKYEFTVWVRSASPFGETHLYNVNGPATVFGGTRCEPNDRQWIQCRYVTGTLTAAQWTFGVWTWIAAGTGQAATAASTIYVWGADAKPLPFQTSTATAARSADVLSTSGTAVGATEGSGTVWVRPQWSSSTATVDRTIFSTTGYSLTYVAASSVWRLTVGGQTADSAAQSFAAYTDHDIRWRYQTTGRACLSVDGVAEVCSAGAPSALSPGASLYVGSDGSAGAGVYLRRFAQWQSGSALPIRSVPTSTTLVATLGDSITYGVNQTIPWPALVATAKGAPWRVDNYGQNSDTAAGMLERWQKNIRGKGYGYLVLMGGVNDIRVGTSAATTWSSLKTIVDEAKTDGVVVVLLTVTPFKNFGGFWSAGKQTELETLNSTITAYVASQSLRGVDTYAALVDPGNVGALLPAYDSGDNIHPNQTAAAIISGLVAAQVY